MKCRLHSIAHARAGDKGDVALISLIAYRPEDYGVIVEVATSACVSNHFRHFGPVRVERFEVPLLNALNFVIHGVLKGGVTRSLALDAHGKSLSSYLLELEFESSIASLTTN